MERKAQSWITIIAATLLVSCVEAAPPPREEVVVQAGEKVFTCTYYITYNRCGVGYGRERYKKTVEQLIAEMEGVDPSLVVLKETRFVPEGHGSFSAFYTYELVQR